jgi:hypothetical protein
MFVKLLRVATRWFVAVAACYYKWQKLLLRGYPKTFCVFTRPLCDNGIQAEALAQGAGALTGCD